MAATIKCSPSLGSSLTYLGGRDSHMATEVKETTREITFPVTGMTCASCVRRIERSLGKVEGVQEANVNLATEKAKVVFDPTLVGLPEITAAVEKAGYKVGGLPTPASPSGDSATAVAE